MTRYGGKDMVFFKTRRAELLLIVRLLSFASNFGLRTSVLIAAMDQEVMKLNLVSKTNAA
jgi:hypothetical protein